MIFTPNDLLNVVRVTKRHIAKMPTIESVDGFDLKIQLDDSRTWYCEEIDALVNEQLIEGKWTEVSCV